LVKYFAFFSLRQAAINIIFVYLEFLNKALQLPFWVKFSHSQSPLGSYEMWFTIHIGGCPELESEEKEKKRRKFLMNIQNVCPTLINSLFRLVNYKKLPSI